MKLKIKRLTMIALLFTGVIWDLLCVWDIVPLVYFTLSIIVIGGYSLVITYLPLLFPIEKIDEKSKAYSKLTSKEKFLSGMTIALSIVWLITLSACIIYSH